MQTNSSIKPDPINAFATHGKKYSTGPEKWTAADFVEDNRFERCLATISRRIHVTFFFDQRAQKLIADDLTLEKIAALVRGTHAKSNAKLPWIKLAKYGAKRTDKNCLRHDANVISISGIELDYDGKIMTLDAAIKTIKAAGIRALLYTTASYTNAAPKWRILCPTSRELPPGERAKLVARVNGLYGGVFDPASFNLSQSFYFGFVGDRKPAGHRAEIVDGDYIDLRDDLDAGALGKQKTRADGSKQGTARGFAAKLTLLGDGKGLEGFNGPLCSAVASHAAKHGAGLDRASLKEKLREAIEAAPKGDDRKASDIERYLSDAYLDGLIESAIEKFGHGDEDVRRLNEVHSVLPIGGKTKVVIFGELEEFPGRKTVVLTQTFDDFAALQNKYRHVADDGKSYPLGSYWLNSQHRRQYDGGQAFMPRHDEPVVGNKLNLWAGYGVQPGKGDCGLFLDFACEVICSANKEHFDYLVKREAFILQKRKRSEIALALQSKEEGVGKGLYERIMGHLYGNHAMQIANPAHVIGKFNPHLESLLRLTADEALFVGDPRHRNALFGLVTEAKLTIEPKFAGVYSADSYLNLLITTNADHFIPVSGTARRFFVPTVSPCHMQDFGYFEAILKQMRSGGYEALLYHLLHIDLSKFNVREVPKTAGLAEQAAYSRKGVEGLVEEVCSMARVPAPHTEWPGFTVTSREVKDYGFEYSLSKTTDPELKRMSPLTISKRLCKDWDCVAKQKRHGDGGKQRTSGIQWPSLADLRQKFSERFGQQEWQHSKLTKWERG